MKFDFHEWRALPEPAERELILQHEADVERLLPLLGPLFGLAVVLFSVWDYMIDPAHAPAALLARAALVLLGAPAYFSTKLPWTATQRCGYIYCTHASAAVVAEYLLQDGFLYGLAGTTACVFAASVTTLRLKTLLAILSIPSLLFVVLSAVAAPFLVFVNGLMLYLFSVGLACIVMLVMRLFRQRAFLSERELLHISRHDALTGAFNLRYLTELAEREMALARRHERMLAVAMIDIDHFKRVNDTYGHDIGDKVIKILVDTCHNNLRATDHFGRTGGEEFVWIMPETNEADALACAERLRRSVEALVVNAPEGKFGFTISIGVAVLSGTHTDWHALLKDADIALYCAKRDGRNRVVPASVCGDAHDASSGKALDLPTLPSRPNLT